MGGLGRAGPTVGTTIAILHSHRAHERLSWEALSPRAGHGLQFSPVRERVFVEICEYVILGVADGFI